MNKISPTRKVIVFLMTFLLIVFVIIGVCAKPSADINPEEGVGFGNSDSLSVSHTDALDVCDDAPLTDETNQSAIDASSVTESATTSTETATTTAAVTTQKTTTTRKTTTTTAPDTRNNAQYVVNPNYESKYYIVVFAGKSQSVAVYSKDESGAYTVLTKCFTCSTGADSSPTRTGQYKIRAKYRWRLLVGNVYGQYSSSISSSYLFHSVPYLKQNPSSLNMAEYDKLGTPASHGCIRLCVRDSKWIYDNCPIGTQVNIVNASGPSGADYPARIANSIYDGWDPSDPDSANPYLVTPPTTTTESTTTATTTTEPTTTTATSTTTETTTTSATVNTESTTAATTTATTSNPSDVGSEHSS